MTQVWRISFKPFLRYSAKTFGGGGILLPPPQSKQGQSNPCNLDILHLTSYILTLLVPSYFGPTHYTKGGYLDTTTTSSTLSCTNVKFCRVLDIFFKVSETQRLVENLLYGYHGNCSITWCFSLKIVKMFITNR